MLQVDGLNVLTDPIWADRIGFAKRLSPPGLLPEQLPDIDAVLISHGHYDHCISVPCGAFPDPR
ncbi:hypothetical protein BSNK01_18830 [Bacillaceae bacterium]